MTRAVVIANPNASRANSKRLRAALTRLRAGGLTVELAATREAGHGAELARAALEDGVELLIASGGDGTIMEVATVLAGTGRPLGILPAGTGNRLADNLGIAWEPREAADVILTMRPRAIDLGRLTTAAGTRYFAVAGGCGFDAEVMDRTSSKTKRAFGVGAYLGTAINLAFNIPRSHVRVEVDGVVHEQEAVMVLLANCGEILPSGTKFAEHIHEDDGLLDIVLGDTGSFAGAARIAWRLASGRSRADGIKFLRGRSVKVTAEPSMAVQADGDLAGRTPMTADLLPGGLTVLAPPAR